MAESMVWISGASSGIGAALAGAVPDAGARVVDLSRSGGTPGTEHVPADLADPDSWAAVEAHLLARLGGFSGERAVFWHCAGVIEPIGFAGEVDSEAYRRNVALNAAAPQALGHAFLRASRRLDCPRELVILTSGAATTPYEGWSGYAAGKAAVNQWVRVVGAEQRARGSGCRVMAVAPGVVATPMQERVRASSPSQFPRRERFAQLHDRGQLADPQVTARRLWALLDDPGLESGAVLDLRDR